MNAKLVVIRAVFAALVFAFGGLTLCAEDDAHDLVKVKGRGVGEDKAAALKDAFRDAVERAVGLYVDAEQQVENDEVIEDRVLTQSNAYVFQFRSTGELLQ